MSGDRSPKAECVGKSGAKKVGVNIIVIYLGPPYQSSTMCLSSSTIDVALDIQNALSCASSSSQTSPFGNICSCFSNKVLASLSIDSNARLKNLSNSSLCSTAMLLFARLNARRLASWGGILIKRMQQLARSAHAALMLALSQPFLVYAAGATRRQVRSSTNLIVRAAESAGRPDWTILLVTSG
jgi:hypothetical protein